MPSTPTAEAILAGDRRALAKAITLVESQRDADRDAAQALLQDLLPHSGNSIRVGVTGVPGVGKSTFIETFGQHVINQGPLGSAGGRPQFTRRWRLNSR